MSSIACFQPDRKQGDGEGAVEPYVYAACAHRTIREIHRNKEKEDAVPEEIFRYEENLTYS